MPNKPLTIDVQTSAIPSGTLDSWSQLNNTNVFIKSILTPDITKGTHIGQIVSGIPTAFARVDLFKVALEHVATDTDEKKHNNLIGYYNQLADEWRGLLACFALDYANISVKKIDLKYSDGATIDKTRNIYEPKGAFGNMLLERKEHWCDHKLPDNQKIPHINIIKYKGQVVGATSPESLLFTSTGYSCDSKDCPWVDASTGKFTDPLKSVMTPIQLVSLHAYVCHVLKGIDKLTDFQKNANYSALRTILSNWKKKIEDYVHKEGYDLSAGSTPPVSAQFSEPYNQIFCYKDILYGIEGIIYESFVDGCVQFDPKTLLLDESARIARLDNIGITQQELKHLPILILTATHKNDSEKYSYFSLPLSALGLNVFGKNIAALVGLSEQTSAISSKLNAIYTPNLKQNNLEVTLSLNTKEGKPREFKKIYTCGDGIKNRDILLWPNFISTQWNSYFLYSEMPHNGTSQSYRAFPFVGEMQGNYFRILVDDKQNPILLSKGGKIESPKERVEAELLVVSNEAVADNNYKYEIYRSNKPFKGVKLLSSMGNEGGYLLINYSSAQGTTLPQDWLLPGSHHVNHHVQLGIDFGSTNTAIAYSSHNGECGFEFTNQRVSLMGYELPGKPIIPRENQVFFFQGASPNVKSNAVKSILTLHDYRRLPEPKQGETIELRNQREVVGGFPCFSDNLPFVNSDDKSITLRYPNGVGEVKQIHNMKWENTSEDIAHKSAFLRTLMLQIYANLYVKQIVPTSLKWSYPSSMSGQLLLSYQHIWDSLKMISPVLDETGKPIKLDVSKYIDTRIISDTQVTVGLDDVSQNPFNNNPFDGDNGFGNFLGDSSFGGSSFGCLFNNNTNNDFCGGDFNNSFNDTNTHNSIGNDCAEEFIPDDLESEIRYNPQILYKDGGINTSLSEAEAVANFISTKYGTEQNVLNLCFDVGGSTTDISALFYLNDGVTMIKQNSLRFAAQRVSRAVSVFSNFKNVLLNVCAHNQIQMVGLNFGNDTYNEHTASYFFDQMVSRLKDDQLGDLYQTIAANCPGLMCVNLYVTGLLMYYAGQLANKLITDLKRTPKDEWPARRKPNVRITFAGKGARLFQWLETINPKAAQQYYGQLFVMGYGKTKLQQDLAGWQKIELPQLGDNDTKYEVSKGLAKGDTTLQKPTIKHPSEIIGESGFELLGKDNQHRVIEFTNSITPAMIQKIGINLSTQKSSAEKFKEFCGIFYNAASTLFGWQTNINELINACENMNITSYVQNMPEHRQAKKAAENGQSFDFVAPIIIIEGMKFYEETLLKLLKN